MEAPGSDLEPQFVVNHVFSQAWRSVDQIASFLYSCGWVAAGAEDAAHIEPKGAFPSTRFEAWTREDYVLGAAELSLPANTAAAHGSWILVEVSTQDGDEARWLEMLDEISRSPRKERSEGDFIDTAWARDAVPNTLLVWRLARNRGKPDNRMSYLIISQAQARPTSEP